MKTFNVDIFVNDNHAVTVYGVYAHDADEARWRVENSMTLDFSVEENE